MKEEFKMFVRKKPELAKYVNSGKTSWQKLYEQYSLYGEDEKVWNEYKNNNEEKEENTKKEDSFSFSAFTDMVKKIDMDQVKKGVNSLQKIVELIQGFTLKDTPAANTYEPRQIFKKFED